MIILLSPAKTMDMQKIGSEDLKSSTPEFVGDMEVILKILQKKSPKQLAQLFNSNDKIAKENHQRYSKWDEQQAKQAAYAFQGQAYKPLDFPSLQPIAQKFGQKHLRILCGLYGVLKPFDLIKAYRLEMGSKLSTSEGDLYDFWKVRITEELKKELEEFPEEERFVVNLASKEYYSAVDFEQLGVPIYNVNFRGATVHIKQARGAMTRYLLQNQISDPQQLKHFQEGWKYDDDNSDKNDLDFIKSDAKQKGGKRKQGSDPAAAITTTTTQKKQRRSSKKK